MPEPHFTTRVIGYFHDDKLAHVQTPHSFYNFDFFQARYNGSRKYYWEEGNLFYQVILPGRNRWGCPIFADSAAMFRRNALEEVGYIAVETITEDLHTGLRINAKGWRSLAISERLVAGQAGPQWQPACGQE
jgi:cellulose synthase/poly-beta-1,6-N-acetylglucosamine synthase-like glycosyltransferase